MFRTVVLVLYAVGAAMAKLDLTILHTNDMHGRFEETSQNSGTCKALGSSKCYGGFARVANIVRKYRTASERNPEGPATIFLNAGDTYTGTPWFSVHKATIASDFINRLAPDCISFGNHEFDFGVEGLIPFLEKITVPIVAANLEFSKDSKFTVKIPKSYVLTVRNEKIGVIGYLLPDTQILSSTGNVTFLDEVEAINQEAIRLDAEGVKIIIALGHSGYEVDKRIAKECPLVDVVIGGHTNTFLWNGPQPDSETPEGPYPTLVTQNSGKIVPVAQAYAYTKYIGRLNVTFNDQGDVIMSTGQPILLNSNIPQETDVKDALEKYRPALLAATQKQIGVSRVDLPIEMCRLEECNFGNMVADAYLEHMVVNYAGNEKWSETSIVIINGGALRMAIDTGSLTNGELLGALPYDMNVISFSLTGADLMQTLETAIRGNGETSRGEFLQVSGLKITYDLTQPVGSRVVNVLARCSDCKIPTYKPVDEKKIYHLVSNDFLLSGGDGYTVLRDKAFDRKVVDASEIQIISNYVEKRHILYPETNGRIMIINKEAKSRATSTTVPSTIAIALLMTWWTLVNIRF